MVVCLRRAALIRGEGGGEGVINGGNVATRRIIKQAGSDNWYLWGEREMVVAIILIMVFLILLSLLS